MDYLVKGEDVEKHYCTKHNGMSVPNGHTYEYIKQQLENGLYETFNITENDGFRDDVIYFGEENNKHKFKRRFDGSIVYYYINQIHLLNKLNRS